MYIRVSGGEFNECVLIHCLIASANDCVYIFIHEFNFYTRIQDTIVPKICYTNIRSLLRLRGYVIIILIMSSLPNCAHSVGGKIATARDIL